jgi:UDP-N-acetylglucosamine acyltransferase
MRGGAGISKDLPPYTMANGVNGLSGLNTVGLRRAGLTSMERLELRRLYHFVFRSGRRLQTAITDAQMLFQLQPSRTFLNFLSGARRGVVGDRRRRSVEEERRREDD